ncbi:hypothetical protein [Curtobacterium flaccumfaciens]|jgi:hypothetical protein|uniref:hypothetical protein n=1 Tax=Curtobacterium flaccumfaciens TaxID=2035 RepID=UPI0039918FAC
MLPAVLVLVAGWVMTIAAAFVPIGWAAPLGVLVFVAAGALGVATSVAAAVVAVVGHVRARRIGAIPSVAWTLCLVAVAAATLVAERVVAVLGIVLGHETG